jgi:CRP/FNR family transcriptional regulator, nitrogen fixation regulation protein
VVEFPQAGDVFGFSAAAVRDCSAETLVATCCTAFDRSAVECSPALAHNLSLSLFSQLSGLHEHVLLLGRKSASERIASFLMRFIPGRGGGKCPGPPKGDDHARVPLAMTRLEIAVSGSRSRPFHGSSRASSGAAFYRLRHWMRSGFAMSAAYAPCPERT